MPKLELDYRELDCIICVLKVERSTLQRALDLERRLYADEFSGRDKLTGEERANADCVLQSIDYDKVNIERCTALIAKLEAKA